MNETDTMPMAKDLSVARWTGNTSWVLVAGSVLLLASLWILILVKVIGLNLNHDEHQFVASGVLLAKAGMLPYRDYAYFHTPGLVFIYGLFFQFTNYYLLAARLFSALCSWLLIITLFIVALRLFRSYQQGTRLLVAGVSMILLAASPIFVYTSGRAWNHDFPILLVVLAFLAHVRGLERQRSTPWLWLSGLLVGLAGATRLSLAPVLLPLLLSIWLWPGAAPRNQRVRATVFFALGAGVGSLPSIALLFVEPQGFLFGNFEYARLNTLYRETIGYEQRMTLPAKLAAFVVDLLILEPGNALVLGSYLLLGRPGRNQPSPVRAWLMLLAGVILILGVAALVPTPSWPQYFYVLYPFCTLGALYGLRHAHADWLQRCWFQGAAGVVMVLAVALVFHEYDHVERLPQPAKWLPVKIHTTAERIAALTGADARILTVAPVLPLEGGLAVYSELAIGPFALRAARFVPAAAATRLHLLDLAQLDTWLQAQPPQAVLIGVHGSDLEDEEPLVAYAQWHGFTSFTFEEGETLWLAPRAQWGDAIRLVTATGIPAQVMAGGTITPVLFLESTAPLISNLNVTVRVVGSNGQTILQTDGWPWGRPTSTWPLHELWYDGHRLVLPPTMQPGLYRIEVHFYDPAGNLLLPMTDLARGITQEAPYVVDYFSMGNWPTAPAVALDPAPTFGKPMDVSSVTTMQQQTVTLLGYDLDVPADLRSGEAVRIQLYWQPAGRLATDYTMFVHLVGPDGQLVAQHDKQPLDGFYPTSRWRPGRPVADEFVLTLPQDASPGVYTLYTGMYDLASGERLPAVAGETKADAWPLTTITVGAQSMLLSLDNEIERLGD